MGPLSAPDTESLRLGYWLGTNGIALLALVLAVVMLALGWWRR